jgi:hypothetical protein
MSGVLLMVLGAWAALAPMVGPYLDLAYTPAPNDAWHWTAERGWMEVLPGAAAFLGGLLLLVSTSRVVTMLGGWLAAAAGAWLIVGPPLADTLNLDIGTPDPTSSTGVQALESLLFFYGVGAAILLLAGVALGRLSVLSVRDVQAAERRIAAEQADAESVSPSAYRPDAEDVGRHGRTQEETPDGLFAGDARPDYPPRYDEPTYANASPPPPQQGSDRQT